MTTKPIGVYDSNWDHRSAEQRARSDETFDAEDVAYTLAKQRIAKRDSLDRLYDLTAFIEEHDLKAEYEAWLLDQYVEEERE